MKIEIKELDASWRELKVTIEAEEASKDYHILVNQYQAKVQIPGFRKGKAPLKMVKQLYGEHFKEEFILKQPEDYYKKALTEKDLHPINEAEIVKVDWEMGKEFVAVYKFQTIPKITIQKYEGLEVPIKEAKFTEDMVTNALETMREKLATQEEVEIAETGNLIKAEFVKVDVESEKVEPVTFEREFTLGKNIYSEAMNTKLTGLKLGDNVRSLIFKESGEIDDEYEDFRKNEFDIRIQSIKRIILPELNDEFGKDAGFDSLQELRDNIAEDYKNRVKEHNIKNRQDAVELALLEANPLELPEAIVRNYADHIAEDAAHQYKIDKTKLIDHFLPLAEHNIKIYYLKKAVADMLDIQVTEEDKEKMIKKAAANMHIEVEEYKKLYTKQINDEDFIFSIQEQKTMDYLIEKAVFIESDTEDSPEDISEDI